MLIFALVIVICILIIARTYSAFGEPAVHVVERVEEGKKCGGTSVRCKEGLQCINQVCTDLVNVKIPKSS